VAVPAEEGRQGDLEAHRTAEAATGNRIRHDALVLARSFAPGEPRDVIWTRADVCSQAWSPADIESIGRHR
jgi:hypothetical protein